MLRISLLAVLAAGAAAGPDVLRGEGGQLVKWLAQNAHKAAKAAVGDRAAPAAKPVFPGSWGPQPEVMTMDFRPLAGGYGHGSSTLSGWISRNIRNDLYHGKVQYPPAFGEPPLMQTRDLKELPFGYGLGSGTVAKWLEEKAKEVYHESADEFHPFLRPAMHGHLDAQPSLKPAAKPEFPASWGAEPADANADYGPLAGGYGHGSSTLSRWIEHNIQADQQNGHVQWPPAFGEPPRMQTRDLRELPFGYGHGSSTIARWLTTKAMEVYCEDALEYMSHSGGFGTPQQDVFSI